MADRTFSLKGGKKLRRCGKHAAYHKNQFFVTEQNKARRARKIIDNKNYWIERVFKKNGKPVKQAA